jgi:FkbM family methyltransferase
MLRSLIRSTAGVARDILVKTGGDKLLAELTVGAPLTSVRAKLAPGNLLYSAPTYRTVVRNGITFELDISDYMQWCVYYGIAIEPRDRLYGLVQAGQTAVDVGTNVGEVLLNFARLVGAQGRVLGMEMNPATYQRCLHNLSLNGYRNVQLFPVGLGDRPAELRLRRPNGRNSGEDRLTDAAVSASTGSDSAVVQIVPLDQLVAEQESRQHLNRIDIIKADVEGFELKVLRGAEQTLARFRPTLFLEVDDGNLRQQGDSAAALIGWLEQHGYRATHAEENRPVRPGDSFAGSHFDVIGLPA